MNPPPVIAPTRPRTPWRLLTYQGLLGAGWLAVCLQVSTDNPGMAWASGLLGSALISCGVLLQTRSGWALSYAALINGLGVLMILAPTVVGRAVQNLPNGEPFVPPLSTLRWWQANDLRFWMSIYTLVGCPLTLAELAHLSTRYKTADDRAQAAARALEADGK